MKNNEYKVGSHILVQGNKGIVEEITKSNEYSIKYDGKEIRVGTITDKNAKDMISKGYELISTGRTATYFKVNFENEESLKNTSYNHSEFGCLDEFENYGTW